MRRRAHRSAWAACVLLEAASASTSGSAWARTAAAAALDASAPIALPRPPRLAFIVYPPAVKAEPAPPEPAPPAPPATPGPSAPTEYWPPAGYPPPPPGTQSYPPGAYPPAAYPPPYYAPPPGAYPPGYGPGYAPGYPYPYGGGYVLPPPPPPSLAPGAETHDGGYLRLQIGLNYTWLSAKAFGDEVQYNGTGASLAIALGYSFTPHLAGYLEALIAGAADTEAQVNGVSTGGPRFGTNLLGFGPGLAYYSGPNTFAAVSFLVAQVQVTDSDGHVLAESKAGFAAEGLLGKEWWVSDNWGLGVSGQLILGAFKGKDPDVTINAVPNWQAASLSLLFSATYN